MPYVQQVPLLGDVLTTAARFGPGFITSDGMVQQLGGIAEATQMSQGLQDYQRRMMEEHAARYPGGCRALPRPTSLASVKAECSCSPSSARARPPGSAPLSAALPVAVHFPQLKPTGSRVGASSSSRGSSLSVPRRWVGPPLVWPAPTTFMVYPERLNEALIASGSSLRWTDIVRNPALHAEIDPQIRRAALQESAVYGGVVSAINSLALIPTSLGRGLPLFGLLIRSPAAYRCRCRRGSPSSGNGSPGGHPGRHGAGTRHPIPHGRRCTERSCRDSSHARDDASSPRSLGSGRHRWAGGSWVSPVSTGWPVVVPRPPLSLQPLARLTPRRSTSKHLSVSPRVLSRKWQLWPAMPRSNAASSRRAARVSVRG